MADGSDLEVEPISNRLEVVNTPVEDDDFDFDDHANIEVAKAVAEAEFDRIDTDKDGVVSVNEWVSRKDSVFEGFGDSAPAPVATALPAMVLDDPSPPPSDQGGRIKRGGTGGSTIHKRFHDQKRKAMAQSSRKTELQVRTLDSQLLPMWPYPVVTAQMRDLVDSAGNTIPGKPGVYLKRRWSKQPKGSKNPNDRVTFPFILKEELSGSGAAVDEDEDEDDPDGKKAKKGSGKVIYMPTAYFDSCPAFETRSWDTRGGGSWSDPWPVGKEMPLTVQMSLNWLARKPFRVDKTGKPKKFDRHRTFDPNEYFLDEATMGPCARGRGDGDEWKRVGNAANARRMYKRWVWDDASDCAANMLSSIAKGQGFAEVLFKSIRVLGGGSDVQAYLDANESPRQRVTNFMLAVERARSSLAQLSRFSVAAEDRNPEMASDAHGTIDFEGNTNQAPYLVVELQDFLRKEDDTTTRKFNVRQLTRMLVLHFGIRPPRVIISLIGAAQDGDLVVTPKLRNTLKNGLLEAPDAWVFTSGLYGGVTKLVAEIMSEIRSGMSATSNINADYAVPVIGIVPIAKLIRSEASEEQREKHVDLFLKPSGRYHKYEAKDSSHLDPNHTFFVFVRDNERDGREVVQRDTFDMCDVDLRRLWMKSLKNMPFESIGTWRRIHLGGFPVESFRVQGLWNRKDTVSAMTSHGNRSLSSLQKHLQRFTREAMDDENQHDHFLEHTTQVATLELCLAGTGDQSTDEGYRSMKLLTSAVMYEYLSPVVVMQGSGGFADLVSYAYRFLHDQDPSASGLTVRGLDAMVRRVFRVFTSGQNDVNNSFVQICTVCAVSSKIVNFDLENSNGTDLDKAFLDALTHTMRAEFHEDAVMSAQSVEKYKEQLQGHNASDTDPATTTNFAKSFLALRYEQARDDEGRVLYEMKGNKRVPVYRKSVCEEQGIDFAAGELESVFDDLVNRYELHLNMLRYAMGFDRVEEAAREIALLDAVWEKMLWWIERSLDVQFQYEGMVEADGNDGVKTLNSLKARNVPSALIQERWIELFYATHERQRSLVGGDDLDDDEVAGKGGFNLDSDRNYTEVELSELKSQFLMLPDQYKLALEYALEDNKVGLVKLLIPKVADSSVNGYDVAEFLYGPNVTRPLDGLGSSLAELYEYEKHPEVRQYLHPILKVNSSQKEGFLMTFLKAMGRQAVSAVADEDFADELLGHGDEVESTQVQNNIRVRKVWSFVMQILKEDPTYESTTWGSKAYEDIFDDDGVSPEELASLQKAGQAYETPGVGGVLRSTDGKKEKKSDYSIIPQSIISGIAAFLGENEGGDRVPYKPWITANFERNILLHQDIIKMQRDFDIEMHQKREDNDDEQNMVTAAENAQTPDGASKLNTFRSRRRETLGEDDIGPTEKLDFIALNGIVAPRVRGALAEDRTLESMWALVSTKSRQERDLIAYHELMVWAVMYNRQELAEYFWQRGGLAIPSALVASVLFTGIAEHHSVANKGKLADVAERMLKSSDAFEEHAVGVMDLCYQHDSLLTQEVLEAELDTFDWLKADGFDSLKLARLAENLEFINHPASQAVIERKWKGGKSPSERRENFNAHVPVWTRWGDYLFAPRISFALDAFCFVVLMCIVAAVALEPISGDFSTLEWVQLAWFSGLVFEEMRQLLGIDENAKDTQRLKDALRDYVTEFWNKVDVAIFTVYYIAVGIRFVDLESEFNQRTAKGLYGLTVCFTYVKLLRYFQIHSDLGPKVTIFFTLFNTLWHYLLLLAVFIVGFGIYVQTIIDPYWNYRPFDAQSETLFWHIIFRPYFQTYGELMLEDMEEQTGCIGSNAPYSNCSYPIQHTLPWVLSVYLAITSIMIINMLIADFTMTFESIHEESTKHWRMGKLSLLDEYEDRTFLPPPLNLPWLLWLVGKHLVSRVTGSDPDDDTQTLKAQEHQIIVEIFQDRLCDQYLNNCHTNVDQDYRLDQIEAKLVQAQSDIKFFKARNMSSSLRVERKYFESAIKSAMANHPDNIEYSGKLLFSKVAVSVPPVSPNAPTELRIVKSMEKHKVNVVLGRQSELDVYHPSTSQYSAVDFFVRKLHKGWWGVKSLEYLVAKAYRRISDLPMQATKGLPVTIAAFDPAVHDRNPFGFHEGMFRELYRLYSGHEFSGSVSEVEKIWNSVVSKSAVSEPMQPGCNRLRMHIVTRWKRDASGMVMEREGHPVLEFVAIKRKSASLHWSIPEISEGAYHRLESFPTLARAQDESATKVYKKSPVEYVAFHQTNLREGVSKEQATKVSAELRELFGSYQETPSDSVPSFLFGGFLDDHRNTGISWINASAYHFHDNRNLTDAWDLTYPGNIPNQPAPAEVAWLTVHSHLDLLGEQEDLLEHVAAKLSAYW